MDSTNILNGAPQFILLTITVAVIAYLRSVPMKELYQALQSRTSQGHNTGWVRLQIAVLALAQIALSFVGVLLTRRFLTQDTSCDYFILNVFFWLALALFVLHLLTNGRQIFKSIFP